MKSTEISYREGLLKKLMGYIDFRKRRYR